jgi:hypothetical protein
MFFCAACSSTPPQAAPAPDEHALAGLAAQQVAVLPTKYVNVHSDLGWTVGPAGALQESLDNEIAAAFDERGLKRGWVFPDQLVQSAKRNAPYATDPYGLAVEFLRSPTLAVDTRLPEPLASQIRTLVALYPNVRLVLAPVELTLERAQPHGGRGVLKVVLMDARLSNIRWLGTITSDTVESFSPAIAASIASRLAGVVAPR